MAPLKYYWPIIGLGDVDSDLHRRDWQVNTIDGPTKLVRQDAILGGLSIGQLTDLSTARPFLPGLHN